MASDKTTQIQALQDLAELEQARGDRAAAFQHLQRFVREHPASSARARAGLAAARLAFEQRDTARGCAMIADARTSAGPADVELRNQIEYYGGHCSTTTTTVTPPATASVTTAGAPRGAAAVQAAGAPTSTTGASTTSSASTTTSASAPPKETERRPSSTDVPTPRAEVTAPASTPVKPARTTEASSAPKASAMRGSWTIQLAAYNTKADAERLVKKLAAKGVKARISGEAKPFRVRLDYYATRQAAAAEVAALKQRGIIGFVTDEPRAKGATHP